VKLSDFGEGLIRRDCSIGIGLHSGGYWNDVFPQPTFDGGVALLQGSQAGG
jgi:hypothetical protein